MVRIIHEKDKKKAAVKAVKGLFFEKGCTIAVKPNVSIQRKEACTDAVFLSYLIHYFQEFSPQNIYIVESDTYRRSIWDAYDWFNYDALGATLVNVSEECCTTVWPENTLFFKSFPYPDVLKVDYLISVAKLKTHILTRYTGVLKNQYGLLPFPDKRVFHRYIDKVITDVNVMFPCHFYILEGITAMQGEGPLDGDSIRLDMVFSGDDPVAIDHCACTIVGIPPETVTHLGLAEKARVGSAQYEVEGEPPKVDRFTLPQKR